MSTHDSKRYFWLKLKEDFFDDDAISWLEEQNNGKEYALFYLKLCLKSLKNDGVLIRKVGNILVPYDTKKISEITRTDEDTVIVAMELLKKIGLIELQENGALYMTQLSTMIGSETNGAERKRRYREAQEKLPKGDNVPQLSQNCPEHFPPELDKELDIEKVNTSSSSSGDKPEQMFEEDEKFGKVATFFSNNLHPISSEIERDWVIDAVQTYSDEWVIAAIEEAVKSGGGRAGTKYLDAILQRWAKDGFKAERKGNGQRFSKDPRRSERQTARETARNLRVHGSDWSTGDSGGW